MNQGWQCPRCHTVYAPSVSMCVCAQTTVPMWPTTLGGWTCFNCKKWVPYSTTHLCTVVFPAGGAGGASGGNIP